MKLSKTQNECYSWILMHGEILRYPGGFWAEPDADMKQIYGGEEAPEYSFGTNTIRSLEIRGLIKPTAWGRSRYGKFPIKYEPNLQLKSITQ